jgi:hypothetical protein
MKHILLTIYFISNLFVGNTLYCTNNTNEELQITYNLPKNFKIINTFNENGVLTVTDKYGNAVDIYVDSYVDKNNVDIEEELLLIKQDTADPIISEKKLPDGYLLRLKPIGPIDPVDTIVIIKKGNLLIKGFLIKFGDSHSHGAFEKDAIQLMRSIARGGKNVETHKGLGSVLCSWIDAFVSQGRSIDVPSI